MGNLLHEIKAPLLMLLSQLIFAGVNVMYKVAANDGMNLMIVVVYRFLFATASMLPLALIFEWKSLRKINGKVFFQAFLCGLFGGSLAQNLYIQSMQYTSATYVSAIFNLVPAFTFVLGICFKLEKLGLRTHSGRAKALGTLVGVGGAMTFIFYQGPEIRIWSTNINILHKQDQGSNPKASSEDTGKFILGAVLGLLSSLSISVWLIIQTKMNRAFPFVTTSTALMGMMATIQGALVAFYIERDWSQWTLGWNIRLLAVVFLGVLGAGVSVLLISWAVRMKGPLYASNFTPLGLVFVGILGSLIMDEMLYVGNILGGILIVTGLYLVLRGKAREMNQNRQAIPTTNAVEGREDDVQIENAVGLETRADDVQIENTVEVKEDDVQIENAVEANEDDDDPTENAVGFKAREKDDHDQVEIAVEFGGEENDDENENAVRFEGNKMVIKLRIKKLLTNNR